MNKLKGAVVAFAIIVVTTLAVVAATQISHQGPHQHGATDIATQHEQMLNHLSEKLKLSDQQKTQARQILADSKPVLQSLHERLKETHRNSLELVTNGIFDEQKSQQVAEQHAELSKQLLLQTARTHAQLFVILTPEQREQAKQLMNQFLKH